jgi:hypothetical protein
MPKWKVGAKEFTVSVSYHETRGTLTTIPKPVVEHLSHPEKVTFVIHRGRIELRSAESASNPSP